MIAPTGPGSALLLVVELNGPTMMARIGAMRALNRNVVREFDTTEGSSLGAPETEKGLRMTVLIYVNTSKQVGDANHLKVFANVDAAEKWFEDNDPEGVAFEYEVLE